MKKPRHIISEASSVKSSAISSTPYIDALYFLADLESDIVCLTCSEVAQVQFERSPSRIPQSLITLPNNISAAIAFCAGLAREGFKPFLHASAAAISRAGYELLISQIAAPHLPVRLIGFEGGLTHEGGVSGQAIEDLALFSLLPNFTVAEVGDAEEIMGGLPLLNQVNGPVYLRTPMGEAPRLFDGPPSLRQPRVLSTGTDLIIFSMGTCSSEVMRLTEALKSARVQITHLHLFAIKPIPIDAIKRHLKEHTYKGVITLENHLSRGGLGTMIEELLNPLYLEKKSPRLIRLGLQDSFAQGGTPPYLLKKYGMDVSALLAAIEQLMKRKIGVSTADLPPSPWKNRTEALPIR